MTDPLVPAWAYEEISIEPYSASWPVRAEALIASLRTLLPGPIEFVGSTSVPGLPAKPIVDLMASVESFDFVDQFADVVAPLGWHYVPPELDGRDYRRFFVHVVDDHRNAHLHLMRPGADRWTEQLQFRDRLRSSASLRDEYAALKLELAEAHGSDREAYSAAKASFIEAALR